MLAVLFGSYSIPSTVAWIVGSCAFYNCRKLRLLTVGTGSLTMGSDVFLNCFALETIRVQAGPEEPTGLFALVNNITEAVRAEFCPAGTAAPLAALWYPAYWVTDSEARVCIGENKPGVNNLIGIYSAVTGKTADEITAEFEGKGYGDFKTAVGEAVVEELRPVRENYERYISDKATLEEIYRKGAERAERLANKTLYRVMKKIGYVL